jgi:hypothetical protein
MNLFTREICRCQTLSFNYFQKSYKITSVGLLCLTLLAGATQGQATGLELSNQRLGILGQIAPIRFPLGRVLTRGHREEGDLHPVEGPARRLGARASRHRHQDEQQLPPSMPEPR